MTLAEKNQNFFQKHHKLLAALLAVALPYAGFNGYQEVKKAYDGQPATATSEVTVNVASMPESDTHKHIAPLSKATIQKMIDEAIEAHQASNVYHEFDG